MLKSRKAISPILATLLLVVIAVAAIVVTYAWIMNYMGSTTQQAEVRLYKENVRFYGTPTDAARNRTEITVGNQGTGNTQIVRVYLGNSSESMMDITSNVTISSGGLNAGSTTTITVNWPNAVATSWAAGNTYYLRIVPNPGQYLEFQEQAPQ
jgi:flagellin-like protein